jgi:hypothetical protein
MDTLTARMYIGTATMSSVSKPLALLNKNIWNIKRITLSVSGDSYDYPGGDPLNKLAWTSRETFVYSGGGPVPEP